MSPKNFLRGRFRRPHGSSSISRAAGTLSRGLKGTGSFLTRNFWLWPLIGFTLLAIIGTSIHSSIESTMKSSMQSELQTLLEVETAMLRTWLTSQEGNAESAANNINVRMLTLRLLGEEPSLMGVAKDTAILETANGDLHAQLAKLISPALSAHDYTGYVLLNRKGEVISASETELVGQSDVEPFKDWLAKSSSGDPTVSRPFRSVAAILDDAGQRRTGVPTMFVAAPVRDSNFQVMAVLAMRIPPQDEFTRILQLGRIGDSGETYAFNRQGIMISNSRFDEALILLGLIPDIEDANSLLHVQIRDPQGNMTEGFRPAMRRAEQPLTKMVESATHGNSTVDVEGYNDYRGVPVVGAWTWLPDYGFGVATEQDVAEAYRPLTILKRAFWAMLTLLLATSIAILAFSLVIARLQRKAREAAIEARQLGQYELEEKLGEGAMGVVYRGRHAMLRRPTAIKLINSDNVSDRSIQRFEREVQITSQLNNPSTIAIFDYGRTPEDVFYYAMEFLDGVDLHELVKEYGPQDPARIIYIMLQVCDSLAEAHGHGLVHRDIKPANIMLNRRGAKSDVVKVLDFGLVKERDDNKGAALVGTPLYMSPESIQAPDSIDGGSDLYALGAVGYFLATGAPVFLAETIREICNKQIKEIPVPLCRKIPEFPEDLDGIIMGCLEKDRARRPQSAKELARQLKRCSMAANWDSDAADRWWARHDRQTSQVSVKFGSSAAPVSSKANDPPPADSVSATLDPPQKLDKFSLEEDVNSEDLDDLPDLP